MIGSLVCVAGMRSSCVNAAEMAADRGADGVGVTHRCLCAGVRPELNPPFDANPLSSTGPMVRGAILLGAGTARHQPGAGITHRQALFGVSLHGHVLDLGGR